MEDQSSTIRQIDDWPRREVTFAADLLRAVRDHGCAVIDEPIGYPAASALMKLFLRGRIHLMRLEGGVCVAVAPEVLDG